MLPMDVACHVIPLLRDRPGGLLLCALKVSIETGIIKIKTLLKPGYFPWEIA